MAFTYTKRKDGRLCTSVMENGKRKYFYAKDEKELKQKLIDHQYLSNKGVYIDDESLTVGQWADKWLNTYKSDKAQATINMYKDTIRLYIKPNLGHIKLKNLKQSDIISMLNELDKKGITRRKEYTLITLKQILQKAVENDYIYKNVAIGIKLQKHKTDEKGPLSDEVITRIRKLSEKDYDVFMILFMIYTGVRRGEIVPLQYTDLDMDNKLLIVNKAVHFYKNQPVLKKTKTECSRTIPVLDILYEKLKSLKSIHKPTDYIFTNSLGKMMTETSMKRKLKHTLTVLNQDYLEEKKKSDNTDNTLDDFDNTIQFTYHQLRHTYVCILHKAGIDIKEAQSWTGHSTVQVLLDIYTHLDAQDKTLAMQKLNNFVN